jgi:predicted ArsR family transcriptional regulator
VRPVPEHAAARDLVAAQPTRARILAILREEGRAVETAELAAALGLHPTGVRLHLERLRGAGLVRAERVVHGRGRPRHAWWPAGPAADPPDAGAVLSVWLAGALATGARGPRGVEDAGLAAGRELGAGRAHEPAARAVRDVMASLGFQPRPGPGSGDGRSCLTLGNCPYRDAVRANREAICTLHRGLVRGVLAAVDPGARLTRFVPHDPDAAGCEIEVSG